MDKEKIAITLDKSSVSELDFLVGKGVFRSRSQAIQEAVSEKLARTKRTRLAAESAKLAPAHERALAEEGFSQDMEQWPEY